MSGNGITLVCGGLSLPQTLTHEPDTRPVLEPIVSHGWSMTQEIDLTGSHSRPLLQPVASVGTAAMAEWDKDYDTRVTHYNKTRMSE